MKSGTSLEKSDQNSALKRLISTQAVEHIYIYIYIYNHKWEFLKSTKARKSPDMGL